LTPEPIEIVRHARRGNHLQVRQLDPADRMAERVLDLYDPGSGEATDPLYQQRDRRSRTCQ
jgi:hypothetical protein